MKILIDTNILIWYLQSNSQLSLLAKGILTECYLSLPLHHRDPFDRMLIAQAINYSLVIITADSAFDLYPIQRLSA